MKKLLRKWIQLIPLFFLSIGTLPSFAVTLNQLVDPRHISELVLSPDGRNVAAIAATGENHGVIVINVDSKSSKLIKQGEWTNAGDIRYAKEPRRVFWIGNDLLAIDYGVYSETVDLDGKFVSDIGDELIRKIDEDNPDSPLLLVRNDYRKSDLSTVNAKTGAIKAISLPRQGYPLKLVFDQSGQARAVTMYNSSIWDDATTVENWYRASSTDSWVKLAEFNLLEPRWTPVAISEKDSSLIVSSNIGRDTQAIFRYDILKHEIGEVMAAHPTEDILDVRGFDGDTFKWVETSGMIPQRYWFDSAWNKIQKSIDATLPNRINMLSGNANGRILVFSYGDVDPGRWFVLDSTTMKMSMIIEKMAQIDPEKMIHMEIASYRARDGFIIPAYLTKPLNAQSLQPAIVLVHGGPVARDQWEWNKEVQLLADRGYVVFQPQFRGSLGFGWKFEQAGFHQWGQKMQDDISDGVDYLIKQGIADPKRICIFGASYGGYAAMWGLAETPDLYRCGISFAGVSDLNFMFRDFSIGSTQGVGRESMRIMVGDRKTDKVALDLVSPLLHANQIKAPLLLMHGEKDYIVPISHGRKMKAALEENNKVFEWVEFPRERHGFTYVKDEFKYYSSVLHFLDQYNPSEIVTGSHVTKEIETLDIKAEKLINVVTY